MEENMKISIERQIDEEVNELMDSGDEHTIAETIRTLKLDLWKARRTNRDSMKSKGLLYEFYDADDNNATPVLIRINSSTLGANELEAIKLLLDEYRKTQQETGEGYNITDWAKLLTDKGLDIEIIKSDYAIPF